ncbi:hypothetical protein LTR66_016974, partial [Elasticomyces elasticus]
MSDIFRSKIIVGVDFVCLSYIPGTADHARDPEIIARCMGGAQNETREKVRSKIAYTFENNSLSEDTWGFGVQPGHKIHSRFRLLLDNRTASIEFDDPLLRQVVESSIAGIPRGKSAEDVPADFLTHLYKHCIRRLKEKMTPAILNVTPLKFWYTISAIWSNG